MLHSYNGAALKPYYFHKNLQGDVIAICDENGNVVAEYAYDAWGNCTVKKSSGDAAQYNPIRYRSYYWDRESNLYYLNARYYDPTCGRFISPDSVANLNPSAHVGLNLYLYAGNDPVNGVYGGGNVGRSSETNCGVASWTNIALVGEQATNRSGDYIGNALLRLSSTFSLVDKISSCVAGAVEGLVRYAGNPNLQGLQNSLSQYSKWMIGIGVGLDVLSSAYSNHMNTSLTPAQKWGSFLADVGYIAVSATLSYYAGTMVVKGAVWLGAALGGTLGGVVVVVAIVAGTILIATISDKLDNWWEQKKGEWFN